MADIKILQVLVITLVLTGLLLGIGMLVFSKFGDAVAEQTTVTDETVTIASGVGKFANIDQGIVSVSTTVTNATNGTDTVTITAANWTTSGAVALGQEGGWNFTYVYDKNVTATDVMADSIDAMSPIASDWIGLIVTVVVLSIILSLVLTSFARRR